MDYRLQSPYWSMRRSVDAVTYPVLITRPVHIAFRMVRILTAYILLNYLPSIPNRSMVTAWSPQMLITKLLEVGKLFPQYPACPAFQSFGNKTERILWRVFKENMYMVWIYRNFDYLNIQLLTGLAKDAFCNHCDIAGQYLSPVFRGERPCDLSAKTQYACHGEALSLVYP